MNTKIISKFLSVFVIAGVLQLIFSCSTLREFEIAPEPDQIVIGGAFAADSVMEVSISKSQFILNDGILYETAVKDAVVNILEGGNVIDQLIYFEGDFEQKFLPSPYRSASDFKPEIGKTYEIEVHHNEFSTATSSTKILPRININSLVIENRNVKITKDYSGFPVSVEFDDPADEKNYYRVQALFTYSLTSGGITNSEFPITLLIAPRLNQGQDLSEGYPWLPGLYISDNIFNGEKHAFDFFVDSFQLMESTYSWPGSDPNEEFSASVTISLQHITKELYDFGVTGQLQLDLSDDPFAEPVPVKSNIAGGLGIFSGYSHDVATQEIK